jgi:dipeptidyl aminopeptidase/acylaminoacyl peptidase
MRIHLILAAALLAQSGIITQAAWAAGPTLPIADFTRYDELGTIKISPDGKFVAMTAGRGGSELLLFIDLETRQPVHGVRSRTRTEIAHFEWISPTRVIYQIAEVYRGRSYPTLTGEIGAIDRDGKQHRFIYGYRAGEQTTGTNIRRRESSLASPEVVSQLRGNDREILITEQPWRLIGRWWQVDMEAQPLITRLNVYNGSKSRAGIAPLAAAQVLTDHNDEVRFAFGFDAESRFMSNWKPRPDADWQAFEFPEFRTDSVMPVAFTDDGRGVYFRGVRKDADIEGLYLLDPETHEIELVYAHAEVDIDRLLFDARGRSLVGVRVYADRPQYHWLNPDHPLARLYGALQRAFAGQEAEITSLSDDGTRAVAFVWSDVNPGEYFLLDTRTMRAEPMPPARAWIDPRDMRPKQPIQLESRDGLTLHGYVTRPAGEGPHPMVVIPHGGPHGVRDGWYFDPEVQLLANRGFAVLQVNFRGSSGYGISFQNAGYRRWGTTVQDDIADATRWAIREGIAEDGRVCIFGSSFGGYSALMSAVREPELYRCAVSFAGVYDLELMHTTADIPNSRWGRAYLDQAIGQDVDQLRQQSPAHHAERIAIPLLLIHGTEDWRADFQQARTMTAALDRAKMPYEWVELKGEGHYIADEDVREDIYGRILAFLDRNLAD